MKSERRHDLETNELAIQMKGWLETIKPHTGTIIGAIVVAAAAMLGWSTWSGASGSRQAEAWEAYTLAAYSADPDLLAMKQIADNEDYAATNVPEWAYLAWCDRQLFLASRNYLISRENAMDRLKQIQGIYDTLSTQASEAQLRDRAHFGLAQVYELQDKLDLAKEQYAQVTGDYAPLAQQRLAALEADDAQDICKWLATATLPKLPKASAEKAESDTGKRPSFEAEEPSTTPAAGQTDNRTLEELLMGGEKEKPQSDRYQDAVPADKPATEQPDATDTPAKPAEESAPAGP
jgi:hypothetical protein